MSQTLQERLKDYLAQLPPRSQAMLMREFERALERGEDTAVASFVLEALRKIVRGSDDAQPRSDDPARLLFRPLEPFLVDGSTPPRPGQIRRTSLAPIWQWLRRDGAPEQAGAFEALLASREGGKGPQLEAAVRKLQLATAEAILKITGPAAGGDKQRALSRVGPPSVTEDLLPIGAVLQAREALDGLNGRLPSYLRAFGDSQMESVISALNVPSLQTPMLL